MGRAQKYPPALIERGVRTVLETGRPIAQVARDLGMGHELLRRHVRRAEAELGTRPQQLSSNERAELARLRQENAELKRANAILKEASVYFATELDPIRRR
jgi:transposase